MPVKFPVLHLVPNHVYESSLVIDNMRLQVREISQDRMCWRTPLTQFIFAGNPSVRHFPLSNRTHSQ